MTQEIDLLNQASFEIKKLRHENSLMSARLEMFDNIMMLLHSSPATKSIGMSEDLVWKIEKHIASIKSYRKPDVPAVETDYSVKGKS